MFIATFEASGGPDFMAAGNTDGHARYLMKKMWERYEINGGYFRFLPTEDDINVTELNIGQGVIDHYEPHDVMPLSKGEYYHE